MEPSEYWIVIGTAVGPIATIIISNSFLIINKERFDFYYLFTDLLIFAKQTEIQLLKASELKLIRN